MRPNPVLVYLVVLTLTYGMMLLLLTILGAGSLGGIAAVGGILIAGAWAWAALTGKLSGTAP